MVTFRFKEKRPVFVVEGPEIGEDTNVFLQHRGLLVSNLAFLADVFMYRF